MNFLDLVKQRYSCRSYQAKSVEQEKVDYVMECVRFAPSAVNKQPWRFHVISSDGDKEKLRQCYNREWFTTAPMYVIASILHDEEWVRSDGKHHGDIDIAIAVEHLCLAAFHSAMPLTHRRRKSARPQRRLLSGNSSFCLHFDFCNLNFLAIFENDFHPVSYRRKSPVLQTTDN